MRNQRFSQIQKEILSCLAKGFVKGVKEGQFDFWLRNDKRKTVVRKRSAFMNRLFNVEVVFQ